jgi:signal peptide peptidase SppA
MRFWNYATGTPWAMTEPSLDTVLTIAKREQDSIEAITERLGRPLEHSHQITMYGQTAVLPVTGPLFRYANLFTAISGATSYEVLARELGQALDNPAVQSIILDIDSPGGEVNGCAELANLIYQARERKPIIAYCSGDAASGAYWIASSCERIVISETASLGSIGVVGIYKRSNDAEQFEIVSSQSPYKRLDPQDEGDRARLQSRIDALADIFIGAVAKHRGLDPPTVKAQFGQGDLLIGAQAVSQDLADSISTLDQTLQELNNQQSYESSPATAQGFLVSNSLSKKEADMPDQHNRQPQPGKTLEASGSVDPKASLSLSNLKADHPQLIQALHEEWTHANAAAVHTQSIEAGRQQERERIAAILDSDPAEGRESLARHLAFATDMSVDMATAAMSAAPKQSASPVNHTSGFESAMAQMNNPAIEPSTENASDDADNIAQRIARYSRGGAL